MRRSLLASRSMLALSLACAPAWAKPDAPPAPQAVSVTVAQLVQWLTSVRGQSDGKIARQLDGMILTERLSTDQLTEGQSLLPGRSSREALTALADLAMLLLPPPAEMSTANPPDSQTQNAIIASANDYVARALARLPDFNATRTTVSFEDAPGLADPTIPDGDMVSSCNLANHMVVGSTILFSSNCLPRPVISAPPEIAAQPLHRTGQSVARVTYRNGMEVRSGEVMNIDSINRPVPGMRTAGEFGPILACVLGDAARGKIVFGYWQQSPQGKAAVFLYSVPQPESSYVIGLQHGAGMEKIAPAYHGEIAIDPATGAILHVSVVADTSASPDVKVSAIVVDYGPVQLGGRNYICPLRGIAVMQTLEKMHSEVRSVRGGVLQTMDNNGLKTQVNDTSFTGYHLLRGDMHILPAQQ